ncbi:protein serine/threonine kinase, putative [Entamoeba invadens IP1]|uniref:Protein serine/threonine kinase, putative n=1 Tax=Entamoeba invadens IP1 TaxID=370355 RepID=A0A0A1UA50_ENTIV|nr:protein serine/threonine kinase, putative [Entamoeba invadens IP1]ELP89019.1 protein serine/threonine kinase, putative [Entamoeba invadens IP1]|eukprot:XP_004255790.1 protein serine/threonine kinase, putative [Entamoeba invadens IP1]
MVLSLLLLLFQLLISSTKGDMVCIPIGNDCLSGFDITENSYQVRQCTHIHITSNFLFDENCGTIFVDSPILVIKKSGVLITVSENSFIVDGGLQIEDNLAVIIKGYVNIEKYKVLVVPQTATIQLDEDYTPTTMFLLYFNLIMNRKMTITKGLNVYKNTTVNGRLNVNSFEMINARLMVTGSIIADQFNLSGGELYIEGDGIVEVLDYCNIKQTECATNMDTTLSVKYLTLLDGTGFQNYGSVEATTLDMNGTSKFNNYNSLVINTRFSTRNSSIYTHNSDKPVTIYSKEIHYTCTTSTFQDRCVVLETNGASLLKIVKGNTISSTFNIYNYGQLSQRLNVSTTSATCVNLISFRNQYNIDVTNPSLFELKKMSNNRLIRICPSSLENKEVTCQMNQTWYSPSNNPFGFTEMYCPCNLKTDIEQCTITYTLDGTKSLTFDGPIHARFSGDTGKVVLNSFVFTVGGTMREVFVTNHFSAATNCGASFEFNVSLMKQVGSTNDYVINSVCDERVSTIDMQYNQYSSSTILTINSMSSLDFYYYNGYHDFGDFRFKSLTQSVVEFSSQFGIKPEGSDPCKSGKFENGILKCDYCFSGSYIEGGYCYSCSNRDGCESCDGTKCTLCKTGYFLTIDNICALCTTIKNCTNCDKKTGLCIGECLDTYYKMDSKCYSCTTKPNCEKCSTTENKCLICTSDSYPSSSQCSLCSTKIGCSKCSQTEDKCTVCKSGYYPNGSGCTLCTSNTMNCKTTNCSTTTQDCSDCKDGYYLSNGKCLSCLNNNCVADSRYCNSISGYCTSCISTYFPQNGACVSCSSKPNCNVCDQTSDRCTTCVNGYYPVNSGCSSCASQNCQTCSSSNGTCTLCKENYYLSGAKCIHCNNKYGCSVCSQSEDKCITCNMGNYPYKETCVSCSARNCKTCDPSTGECLSCDMNNYLNNGECIMCSSTFSNCYKCTKNLCLLCLSNLYFLDNGKCLSCQMKANCSECSPSSNACTECYNDNYPSGSNCLLCSQQMCKTCDSKNGNCTSCLTGYFLNSNSNKCNVCSYQCASCSSLNTCTLCYSGYYLQNGACNSCSQKLNCEQCSTTNNKCSRCEPKYYPLENYCSTCTSKNCLVCGQSDGLCTSCLERYYLNSSSCKLCSEVLTNCETCTSNIQCTKCENGYFLINGKCQACSQKDNCDLCSTEQNLCLTCKSSYYPSGVGCSPCISKNCLSCDSTNGMCSSCVDGMGVTDGSCSRCEVSNCLRCSGNTCLECSSNYYMMNNKCLNCDISNPMHCNTNQCSSTDSSCLSCQIGYFLTNKMCVSCSQNNCNTCDSSNGNCVTCLPNYYLNGTLCNSCSSTNPMNCEENKCSTTSSLKCETCKIGYYINNFSCISCDTNGCASCDKTTGQCTNCPLNKYLKEGNCLSCDVTNDLNCEPNKCYTTGQKCYICKETFYLENSMCKTCGTNNPNHCLDNFCDPTTEGQCILCQSGYVLKNKKCVNTEELIEGCEQALSDTFCVKCKSPYKLLNGSCYQLECTNKDTIQISLDVSCSANCDNGISLIHQCGGTISHCFKMLFTGNIETSKCLQCQDNYKSEGNQCVPNKLNGCDYLIGETCVLPSLGYYLFDGKTNECDNRHLCKAIILQESDTIKESLNNSTYNLTFSSTKSNEIITIIENYECSDGFSMVKNVEGNFVCNVMDSQCNSSGNGYQGTRECIFCNGGYFIKEGSCSSCTPHCTKCDIERCYSCELNYILLDGICIAKSEIKCDQSSVETSLCISCEEGYSFDDKGSCQYNNIDPLCRYRIDNKCVLCKTNMKEANVCNDIIEDVKKLHQKSLFNSANVTYKTEGDVNNYANSCLITTPSGCVRCKNEFYISGFACFPCDLNCKICDPHQCITCSSQTALKEGKCVPINEVMTNCTTLMPQSIGCAKCNDGYYRNGLICEECPIGCSTCNDKSLCFSCDIGFFKTSAMALCESDNKLLNCVNKTITGCTECERGYYLENSFCLKCSELCSTCNNGNTCTSCADGYVKNTLQSEFTCKHYTTIDKCVSTSNSLCSQCEGKYRLGDDGLSCVDMSKLIIIIPTISVIVIFIIIIVIVVIITLVVLHKKESEEKMKDICTFQMNRSNVNFSNEIGSHIVANKQYLSFSEDLEQIKVNEETKEILCIGNTGKDRVKIQISSKEDSDKYTIRTNPNLITLKKGEACEFEIFITPLCTFKIEDQLKVISLVMKTGEKFTEDIKMKIETEMSTRLDPDELQDIKAIGEGSFGVVYLGEYRENQVAIKKMKHLENDDGLIEFEKEVAMLDKFRSDYIVHFYGAVFIPNKVCLVTEFAEFGSLADLMKKRRKNAVTSRLKIKFMLDGAKGLFYLHENGILHRDVKPDNILIVSLNEGVLANGKLTDFGSSRNVNMLMTNMTFTKGIGSPVYMAPEVLKQEKYKKPADVYSFAITMYECFAWRCAYVDLAFKFPWKIAEFVVGGHRLDKPNDVDEKVYNLITLCWSQHQLERLEIGDVVNKLQKLY